MSENGDKIELEGTVHRLGSADAMGRGTMLWFNEAKDMGALRTDDGIRIEVPGEAFSDGERPRGRCAGLEIEFQVLTDQISGITFVPVVPARRARIRRRS